MSNSYLAGRLKSIGNAIAGVQAMFRTQQNAKIHLGATVLVVVAGVVLRVSMIEWATLILAVALVWLAEALNTAFEFICDLVSPQPNPQVKLAKDIAAGGVLLAALGSAIVGVLVLLPHILLRLDP